MTDFKITDRPITGDPQNSFRTSAPQLTPAEFLAQIDEFLAVPGVRGLVWDQYTPYFNDGDPCEFSINEVRALVEGVDAFDENYDFDYNTGFSSWELSNWKTGEPIELPGGVDSIAIKNALDKLQTSSWESVVLTNFGDHASVTATKDGFNVEFYEHD